MGRWEPSTDLEKILAAATSPERLAAANEIAEIAKAGVNTDTGMYAHLVRVFDDDRGVGVDAHDYAAHIIEYGRYNQPAQAPIRTAADSVGKFEER